MSISSEEFATGDPVQLYAQMRPDQRTAIANEFVRSLILADDPAAQRFHYAASDPLATPSQAQQALDADHAEAPPVVPQLLSSEQAAAVHRYVREQRPDLFEEVAHHPLTVSVLARAGEPVAHSTGKPHDELPLETGTLISDVLGQSPEAAPGIEVGEIENREHDTIAP
jgi:hypothetical protein